MKPKGEDAKEVSEAATALKRFVSFVNSSRKASDIGTRAISLSNTIETISFAQSKDKPETIVIAKTNKLAKLVRDNYCPVVDTKSAELDGDVYAEVPLNKFKKAMVSAIKAAEEKNSEEVTLRIDEKNIAINMTSTDADAIMFLF